MQFDARDKVARGCRGRGRDGAGGAEGPGEIVQGLFGEAARIQVRPPHAQHSRPSDWAHAHRPRRGACRLAPRTAARWRSCSATGTGSRGTTRRWTWPCTRSGSRPSISISIRCATRPSAQQRLRRGAQPAHAHPDSARSRSVLPIANPVVPRVFVHHIDTHARRYLQRATASHDVPARSRVPHTHPRTDPRGTGPRTSSLSRGVLSRGTPLRAHSDKYLTRHTSLTQLLLNTGSLTPHNIQRVRLRPTRCRCAASCRRCTSQQDTERDILPGSRRPARTNDDDDHPARHVSTARERRTRLTARATCPYP